MKFGEPQPPMAFGFSSATYSNINMPSFHQHGEIEIGFNEVGTHALCSATRSIQVPTQRILVHWAMIPHRGVQISPQLKIYNLTIPVPWLLNLQLPGSFTADIMRGQPQFDQHPTRWQQDVYLFRQWNEEINSGDAELRKIAMLGIELRLRHLALDLCAHSKTGGSHRVNESVSDMSKVERMASYIATHYHQSLTVAEIAREVRLHEKYAMQLFKRTCDTTLLQFLTQHRVWHAQRMLSLSDSTMSEIAAASGFGSQSRFYALFKRITGLSPREYRHSKQTGANLTF